MDEVSARTTSAPERLRSVRLERGLTYREMAALLEVAVSTYQGWEDGAEPSVSRAQDVEGKLGARIWTRVDADQSKQASGPIVVRDGYDQTGEG